jgi:drug/metabolite transporter, DME family
MQANGREPPAAGPSRDMHRAPAKAPAEWVAPRGAGAGSARSPTGPPAGREAAILADDEPPTGSLLVLVSSVLWGTTGTAQALAPAGARPLAVASVRVVLGGVVLLGLAARGRPQSVGRSSLGATLVAAGSLVVAQLCFFAAVDRTGVAVGTIVAIGSSPIAAGALEWALARRRPTRQWMHATFLAIAGCTLLLTAGRSLDVDSTGVGLALVVGLGYAGYTLSTKLLVSDHPPDVATADQI